MNDFKISASEPKITGCDVVVTVITYCEVVSTVINGAQIAC